MQGFALRRVPFAPDQKGVGRAKSTRPEKRRAPKALGDRRPTPFWWGAQTPAAEGMKNLLSLKAANSHLWWSGVALVVFMIVWWLDRLPVISCSNSAAFLTAEQIFLKAWKARAFSFTPTFSIESFFVYTAKRRDCEMRGLLWGGGASMSPSGCLTESVECDIFITIRDKYITMEGSR